MQFRSLDQGDPLAEGIVIHSSIRAWRIPWTEELGGLYIVHRVSESDTSVRLSMALVEYLFDLWKTGKCLLSSNIPSSLNNSNQTQSVWGLFLSVFYILFFYVSLVFTWDWPPCSNSGIQSAVVIAGK